MVPNFISLCESGDLISAADHLSEKNYIDKFNKNALHYACSSGDIKTVEFLLHNEVSVHMKDYLGLTPIYYAVFNNHRMIVESLVEYGANIQYLDDKNNSLIDIASDRNCIGIVKWFVSEGLFSINQLDSAYRKVSQRNKVKSMLALMPDRVNEFDDNLLTPLLKSCIKFNEKDVLFLLDNGADFHLQNKHKQSAYKILKKKKNLHPRIHSILQEIELSKSISSNDRYFEDTLDVRL